MPPSSSASKTRPSQTPTTFHPWSRLPDELKLHILSYLLIYPRTIPVFRRTFSDPPPDPVYLHSHHPQTHLFPFIQTRNYKLARLAQEVYFKQNTFRIKLSANRAHICPWPRAGCVAARLMKRVHVSTELDVNCTLEEMVDEEGAGRWLFRRRRSVDDTIGLEEVAPAPKAGFEKLDVLYVRITIQDEEEDEYVPLELSEDRVERLKELMGKVELVIGAKEVMVSARVVSFDGENVYDGICGSLGERAMKSCLSSSYSTSTRHSRQ